MAVLILMVAIALAGCYEPSLRDCTVTCNAQSDCASGQVCNGDHYCAASQGTCAPQSVIEDAAIDALVAIPVDAAPDARPDAAGPQVGLHVHIDGKGSVVVVGVGTCSHTDCMYSVLKNVPLVLEAFPQTGQHFDKWTTGNCAQQDESCTFTPTAATTVGAKFVKES